MYNIYIYITYIYIYNIYIYRYKSVKEFVADVRQNERQEIQAQLKKKSNSQHESGFLSRYTRALTF